MQPRQHATLAAPTAAREHNQRADTTTGTSTCTGWRPGGAAGRDNGKRGDVQYVNVKKDAAGMERMLELTGGKRRVPVIVIDGKVTVGFGGT